MKLSKSKIKIVLISDTHRQEQNIQLPKGDILIHCGDYDIYNLPQLHSLNDWFGSLDFNYKIMIAGNHDLYLQQIGKQWCKQLFTNAIYLENEGITLKGLKFWGSPYTPEFNNWAFMYPRNSKEAKELWKKIPKNLDFLITHGQPYGIMDTGYQEDHVGCEVLQEEILKKTPKYIVGGHLHGCYGKILVDNMTFINCSLLDDNYQIKNKSIVVEI